MRSDRKSCVRQGGWRTQRTVGALFAICLALTMAFSGCAKRTSDDRPRYHLVGKVVSIDINDGTATIDHQAIPGYMEAMTMPYAAENPSDLKKLEPGDEIKADIVIDQGVPLLSNIVITGKATAEKPVAKP